MIIESKDDVMALSGSLNKNQWMTIKAAANLLLMDHPQGIIIDCGHLDTISEDGAKTFLVAMRDIEAAHARIIVVKLPENVLSVLKTVPGVRSQLPIAASIEEARASLRMAARPAPHSPAEAGKRGAVILVPLLAHLDLTYGADIAARLAKSTRGEVRLVYFLEVARTLPLNAPLMEEEQAAQEALGRALQYVKTSNVPHSENIEKVREASEGILHAIKTYEATQVVFGAMQEPEGVEAHELFHKLVDILLHRAPCEVIVGRLKTQG